MVIMESKSWDDSSGAESYDNSCHRHSHLHLNPHGIHTSLMHSSTEYMHVLVKDLTWQIENLRLTKNIYSMHAINIEISTYELEYLIYLMPAWES